MQGSRIDYKLKKVPDEWIETRGFGATVLVCDTSIDKEHSAIKRNLVKTKSFFPSHSQVVRSPHGTHVSGTIVGYDEKIQGIAPMSGLFVAQCLSSGRGSMDILSNALDWAIELQPDVINLSVAYKSRHKKIEKRLEALASIGCIICSSQTAYPSKYPACYDFVMSVGAYDSVVRDGPKIEARCPRTIFSSKPMNKYGEMSGHSMSCAFMSGVCCLAKAYDKSLTKDGILEILRGQPSNEPAPNSLYNISIFAD
jgi:subtilisin family serine protease